MKTFHDFFFGLPPKAREAYVVKAGTTVGYVERVAGGFRLPSLKMAHRLVLASGGKTSLAAIIRTYEAKHGELVQ